MSTKPPQQIPSRSPSPGEPGRRNANINPPPTYQKPPAPPAPPKPK